MVRIIQNYTLYEVIGEGAYGKVYRAINKVDNKEYAVKVIQVKKFQTNKKLQECTVHEINILTNIEKNKHIITYYDMLKTQNNFYFVYEYCNGGTLEGLLRKQHTLQQKKALLILKQLLQAFQVLNKYNIMHRDLKPDNIFFHNGVLKVGDFGFCKSLQKAQMTKTMLGSPIYMAPEILNGQIYSNKADIWSIGVVLYQMLYGYCPFQSNSIPKLIQVLKQTQLEMPSEINVSNQSKQLLKKILTKDPQKRIQWMQLFQLKINNQGKIVQQKPGRLSLVDDDKNLLKTVRQINDGSQQLSSSLSGSNSTNNTSNSGNYQQALTNNVSPYSKNKNVDNNYNIAQTNNYANNNFSSPRNVVQGQTQGQNQNQGQNDSLNNRNHQKSDQKAKLPFMRKNNTHPEQAQGTTIGTSPIRKGKISDTCKDIKTKSMKFHEQVIKGISIARSLGFNNQKNTPLFSYFLFKNISERLRIFREEELQSQQQQTKQIRQIIDQQIDEIQYEIAMIRGRVQQFPDWKKAIKSKVLEFKNLRLCYELVMFLTGQPSNENASHNDMSYVIRTKLT